VPPAGRAYPQGRALRPKHPEGVFGLTVLLVFVVLGLFGSACSSSTS
jgi:hypothetical protein